MKYLLSFSPPPPSSLPVYAHSIPSFTADTCGGPLGDGLATALEAIIKHNDKKPKQTKKSIIAWAVGGNNPVIFYSKEEAEKVAKKNFGGKVRKVVIIEKEQEEQVIEV